MQQQTQHSLRTETHTQPQFSSNWRKTNNIPWSPILHHTLSRAVTVVWSRKVIQSPKGSFCMDYNYFLCQLWNKFSCPTISLFLSHRIAYSARNIPTLAWILLQEHYSNWFSEHIDTEKIMTHHIATTENGSQMDWTCDNLLDQGMAYSVERQSRTNFFTSSTPVQKSSHPRLWMGDKSYAMIELCKAQGKLETSWSRIKTQQNSFCNRIIGKQENTPLNEWIINFYNLVEICGYVMDCKERIICDILSVLKTKSFEKKNDVTLITHRSCALGGIPQQDVARN